jgi:hypothetical protein
MIKLAAVILAVLLIVAALKAVRLVIRMILFFGSLFLILAVLFFVFVR